MSESMNDILHPFQPKDPEFPHAPEGWSRAIAEQVASEEQITLTPVHWELIRSLQGYFESHQRPNAREIHDALEEKFHLQGGIKLLFGILPQGPIAQGCRLAGLKPPSGTLDRSFGSVG